MIDTTTPVTMDDQALRTQLTQQIADQLHETQDEPRYIIRLALKLLGHVRVQHLVSQALAIEEQGGMLTADGKRRRTPGGTFFALLRKACTPAQREQLFPPDEKRPYVKRAAKKQA